VRENVKFFGEMDDVKAFEKAESGHGGVEIEARGKAGAEREGDDLERIHAEMSLARKVPGSENEPGASKLVASTIFSARRKERQ
jgi:hypothetical protein